MAVSLYDATIPQFRQTIGAVLGLIDRAEAYCAANGIDPAGLIDERLAPDMLPFGYQVKSVAVHSAGAVAGVQAASFAPDKTPWPTDFAGLRQRLTEADANLAAIDREALNALDGGDMCFLIGGQRREFTADVFLLSFSLPNFFFHAATAYDLLRAWGLPIGKRDFLGVMRLRD